jgi:hypothetical protein
MASPRIRFRSAATSGASSDFRTGRDALMRRVCVHSFGRPLDRSLRPKTSRYQKRSGWSRRGSNSPEGDS